MRNNIINIRYGIILIILGLLFVTAGSSMAVVDEKGTGDLEGKGVEGPAEAIMPGQEPDKSQVKAPEYVPGELIVKLKEGRTLTDIEELNNKYAVSATEEVFKKTAEPQEVLKELKDKLANFGTEHEKWYWQMDKNSQEYKDYMSKMEEEKAALENQIKAQEELIAHLEQRQKRAPEGAEAPKLENTYILKADQNADIQDMAKEYSANPNVEYAEPNYILTAQMVPNDTFYSQQWAPKKIQCESAWDTEKGRVDVVIAIVDTGVAYNHEDLTANIWHDYQGNPGKDFVDINIFDYAFAGYKLIPEEDYTTIDNDPYDHNGHGTHCAGIAGAVGGNKRGIAGMCHKCTIMPVRTAFDIIDANKYISTIAEVEDTVNGIKYAVDNGADVINISLAGSTESQSEKDTVSYAFSKGVIVVAGVGNNNNDSKMYPAAFDNVISVAATDDNDKKDSYSNYGSWVDLSAPGVAIISTVPGSDKASLGGYMEKSGTSFAGPHVTGVAALVISLVQNKGYYYDTNDIVSRLMTAVDDIDYLNPDYKGFMGKGRINANKAIKAMIDTTAPAIPKVVDEGEFAVNKTQLYASWSSEDTESGIFEYQYQLFKDGSLIRDWASTGKCNYVTIGGLSLSDGVYIFSVKAKNKVGLWSPVGYSDGIIIDTTPPQIVHNGISYVPKNNPITFTATVIDTGSGIREATLCWRKRILRIYGWTWSELRQVPMINQGDNIYKVTLLGNQVEDRNIKYYISAKDMTGNIAETPEYEIKR